MLRGVVMKDEKKTKAVLIEELEELRQQLPLKGTRTEFDSLTGLPTRFLAYDRLSQALLRAQREGWVVAVMFLCLENLKLINDTYGRAAGDLLLRTAAERIRSCLRKSDTVARPGRGEFIIVLPEIARPAFATKPRSWVCWSRSAPSSDCCSANNQLTSTKH